MPQQGVSPVTVPAELRSVPRKALEVSVSIQRIERAGRGRA